jgi:hypothetical protein
VDPQNAKRVAVVMDVPDMDALNAVMQIAAAAEAMAHGGVVPETLVILVGAQAALRALTIAGLLGPCA